MIIASSVALDPSVRDETDVQSALEAGVPALLAEQSTLSTTAAPPGDIYASDTRPYDEGFYQISGVTIVGATNNNTEIQVTFALDDALQPNPWVNTPGSTGSLYVPANAPLVLLGGLHKFEVFIARVSGTGSAQAFSSILWVVKIGGLP